MVLMENMLRLGAKQAGDRAWAEVHERGCLT
jgi:hypothetical protein